MLRTRLFSRHFMAVALASMLSLSLWAETDPHGIRPGTLPVTTKSPAARQLFEGGLVKMQNLHGPEAMQDFRKAVKLDPDFALANIMISFSSVDPTVDPAEQVAARERALTARAKVTPGEQLVIDWLADTSEGRIVPAIQAMNTVLDEYQNDRFLAWLGGVWMENQQQITRAIPMFERTVRLDPNFAPPLNELAYCYARVRNFDKAFATMQRYISLLPNEPNPQDSYAEILRMAGKFDDALVHYHASLKLDPRFVFSQLGIADTYALMGDEERARAEYAIAIRNATSKSEAANWRLQSAITYVRENNLKGADTAFLAAAQQAHDDDLAVQEADAYRMMSTYQTSGAAALELIRKAEGVLNEKHPLPALARQQELALILRERASRALRDGNTSLAAQTGKQLQELFNSSHDQVVQIALQATQGTLLLAQGKYEDAVSQLSEDDRNPVSVKLMFVAYQKMGAMELAEQTAKTLAGWNEPTLEQALVVPEFRSRQTVTAATFHRM